MASIEELELQMNQMNSLKAQQQELPRPESSFYLENNFFHAADVLRTQFENLMSMSVPANNSLTPLSYAFCRNAYHFFTAGVERIFEPEILDDLIAALRAWGTRVLGASHVSTPQFRVYINGCSRKLLYDDVSAPWRYALSLTQHLPPRKMGPLNLLTENVSSLARQEFAIRKLTNSHLSFNQMLVHKTSNPYSIDAVTTSMDPLEGLVFLDGYFW